MDRFGARPLDDAMASIAVPGTDPTAVSEYVIGRLAAHRRRSRMLVALAAVLVLMAGSTAFALSGGDDPEEVVAPAEESADDSVNSDSGSDVSRSGSDTVVTTVPTTAPSTLAVPTTSAPSIAGVASGFPSLPRPNSGNGSFPAAPGLVPSAPTGAPGTAITAPPDAPLTASAIVVTGPAVGSVVQVSLEWSDPDLPQGTSASTRVVGSGPGALASAPLVTLDGACTGGTGASGIVEGALRLAKAGPHTITVEVSTCAGEVKSFSTEVTVPNFVGTAVIAKVPKGVNPESGAWSFTPSEGEGAGTPVPLRNDQPGDEVPDNDPRVVQYLDGCPATVLVVPSAKGTISHAVGGTSRSAAAAETVSLGDC